MVFSTELEKKNLKICMETQKAPNSQSNLFFFHLFLFIGGELLYNIVVVFAIH